MNNIDLSNLTSDIFKESRGKTKFSQEHMAKALGVSKKTIISWESGISTPNMARFIQWFDVLGVPIHPYLYMISHKERFAKSSEEAFSQIIKDLSDDTKKKIIFELFGEHGSDPVGVTEMIIAYLHLPLYQRVVISKAVATSYMISEAQGILKQPDDDLPNMELLKAHIIAAMEAVMDGKESYIYEDEHRRMEL